MVNISRGTAGNEEAILRLEVNCRDDDTHGSEGHSRVLERVLSSTNDVDEADLSGRFGETLRQLKVSEPRETLPSIQPLYVLAPATLIPRRLSYLLRSSELWLSLVAICTCYYTRVSPALSHMLRIMSGTLKLSRRACYDHSLPVIQPCLSF